MATGKQEDASARQIDLDEVARLIEALERNDLAARRTGETGYEYNRLRAHVGL